MGIRLPNPWGEKSKVPTKVHVKTPALDDDDDDIEEVTPMKSKPINDDKLYDLTLASGLIAAGFLAGFFIQPLFFQPDHTKTLAAIRKTDEVAAEHIAELVRAYSADLPRASQLLYRDQPRTVSETPQ